MIDAPANVTSIALGPEGVAHLVAQGDHGTWYLSNRSGDFQSEQLSDAPSIWLNASGIAADESGRPHLLFAVGEYERTRPGLIYAVGPTP